MSEVVIDEGGAELRVIRSMMERLRVELPALRVTIRPAAMRAAGDEPSELHRSLAEIGYVPELLAESDDVEKWIFRHPEETRAATGWDGAGRRHGTDKSSLGHGYLRGYETLLAGRAVWSVLEIGVDGGRSLLTWADIWSGADVWGVEIDPALAPLSADPAAARCTVLIGDATQEVTIARLPDRTWDVIVDDGSHQFEDQTASMHLLAPLLSPRGVYIVEDVPWSDEDGGGIASLGTVLALAGACGLRPLGVVWSALRHHVAVVTERRP